MIAIGLLCVVGLCSLQRLFCESTDLGIASYAPADCSLWPCWFRLQGEAHAGIGGARDARVAALALTPQRLSVAGIGAFGSFKSLWDTATSTDMR